MRENEELKMDLSKGQRIPVIQKKQPQKRRHQFFSDPPQKSDEQRIKLRRTREI
ncbi:hypothetical protein [Legionella pneumophila]|uniref:hypothetical protein n=1 Tax=Legionella pneumophila TaxID=446 RepID=UPI0001527884|nr:hypothetical protein [Legionella pneumophila]ABQ54572.1 hypothetical protein LPC_0589 [Legionella pneumophila str. Corby]ADG24505.1 hypothetical protein lpa_01757 [Legionella pneumophila 2300/99 Alcoy]MCZ4680546.1 hypothetical protein [Legionella pneumophila]CZH76722.1 Uncharacterised protein [Legionella pneumophila]CZI31309.1 Uncharacterised protein [Legionella pneumophila]